MPTMSFYDQQKIQQQQQQENLISKLLYELHKYFYHKIVKCYSIV